MDLFQLYATDPKAEENGRWFENGDVEFLIARSGNRAFNDMISVQYKQHKHTLDQKDSPEARVAAEQCADKINVLVMSRSILLGWRGKQKKGPDGEPLEVDGQPALGRLDYQGNELPFTPANAAKVLAHKDFRAWVNGRADDFKNFLVEVKKEDEKNSVPTSSGVSSGAPVSNG